MEFGLIGPLQFKCTVKFNLFSISAFNFYLIYAELITPIINYNLLTHDHKRRIVIVTPLFEISVTNDIFMGCSFW